MGQDTVDISIHTSVRTMRLAHLLYKLAVLTLARAQNVCFTHSTFREPVNSDIQVLCGTDRLEVQILLCPIYFCGYNESLMALNAEHSKEECKGMPDWTVDPPVLRFNFSIRENAISACSNKLTVSQEAGMEAFSDFSHVQSINISGIVKSLDPGSGMITYHEDMSYKFSCRYPLQYLVTNQSETGVSGSNLAVRESNGSFISTLSMDLYSDRSYVSRLQIPAEGLQLKTRIFVEVKATDLADRFNVLLDRCYASTTSFLVDSNYYDLFVGCDHDGQTVIAVNGLQQNARFSFEAFRFVQHKARDRSTFYLHCSTRLCERSFCPGLIQNCTNINHNGQSRKRRGANADSTTSVTDVATVTSGPITTRADDGDPTEAGVTQQGAGDSTTLAAAVAAGMMGTLCVSGVAFTAYHIYNSGVFFS